MSTATTHINRNEERSDEFTNTLKNKKEVSKIKLVPEIRFKGFDGGIVEYLFNDIFLFSTGKNIKQKEASPEFETPCVRYGELYHMYNEVINEVINKTNLEKSELRFSKGDEILLPSAGEDPLDIGSASALTLENIAIGRTINILRPMNENVYSQIFASYYINQKLRKKISTLAKGSSISNVYNSDLKTLKIKLPPLPEQQKIASFLSAVDEKTQQLTKKKALLEQYKKGVMQQLFSGQLRFKDENGNPYPDWEEKQLGDLIKTIADGGTPSTKKPNYYGGDIKWLVIDDIQNEIYDSKQTLTSEGLAKCSSKLWEPETLIMSTGATIGELGILKIKAATKQGICGVVVNENANNLFLKFWLKYNMSYMLRFAQGSSIKELRPPTIVKFKILVPSIEEQEKIARYLSGIDTKTEAVTDQITQTQTFKKGLLQQMFV
jgi:type I restriction enzyme S subunit